MGTNDPSIEGITPSAIRKNNKDNSSIMKFVFALLALGALASVDALPEGTYTDSKFFQGDLDNIQGALIDAATAGRDLSAKEDQLYNLVQMSSTIMDAETILETAVDKTAYQNSYNDIVADTERVGDTVPLEAGAGAGAGLGR